MYFNIILYLIIFLLSVSNFKVYLKLQSLLIFLNGLAQYFSNQDGGGTIVGRGLILCLLFSNLYYVVNNWKYLVIKNTHIIALVVFFLLIFNVFGISNNIIASSYLLIEHIYLLTILFCCSIYFRNEIIDETFFKNVLLFSFFPVLLGFLQFLMSINLIPQLQILKNTIDYKSLETQLSYEWAFFGSTFPHPNVFSHFLALNISIYMLVYMSIDKNSVLSSLIKNKIFVFNFFIMVLLMIILAVRGPFLIVFGTLLVLSLRKVNIKSILFICISIVVVYFVFQFSIFEHTVLRFGSLNDQWISRNKLWQLASNQISWGGIGIGNILSSKVFYTSGFSFLAHNDYLSFLVELGIIGFIIMVLFRVFASIETFRSRKVLSEGNLRILGNMVLILWSGSSIAMFAENLQVIQYHYLNYFLLGVYLSKINYKKSI